jgi:hypothetical protein
MSDPNNNILDETPELKKAIEGTSNNLELLAVLRQARFDQGKAAPHSWDPTGRDYYGIKPVVPAAQERVSKTIVVNGVKHLIESENGEQGLAHAELELMRKLFSGAAAPATSEPARDASGRFVAQQTQAEIDAAEAERLANIDPTAAALAPSVKAALEAQGISVDSLREYSRQAEGEKFSREWAAAGEAFRNSPAGENYPGGTENQRILGEIIVENNLVNAEDKVGAIASAYAYMCENGLVAATAEEKQAAAKKAEDAEIRQAADPEQLREILRKRGHLSSSGLWGR